MHALDGGKPIVIKLGESAYNGIEGTPDERGVVWRREWNKSQIEAMVEDVDVLGAEATKQKDKDKIMKVIISSA